MVCIWILDISACIICKHIGDKKIMADKGLPPIADDYIDPAPTSDETALLVARWNQYAPVRYKGLLEAENLETLIATKQMPKRRFVWSDRLMQYYDVKRGKILTAAERKDAFESFIKEWHK